MADIWSKLLLSNDIMNTRWRPGNVLFHYVHILHELAQLRLVVLQSHNIAQVLLSSDEIEHLYKQVISATMYFSIRTDNYSVQGPEVVDIGTCT